MGVLICKSSDNADCNVQTPNFNFTLTLKPKLKPIFGFKPKVNLNNPVQINSPFRTTWISQCQKGKTIMDHGENCQGWGGFNPSGHDPPFTFGNAPWGVGGNPPIVVGPLETTPNNNNNVRLMALCPGVPR